MLGLPMTSVLLAMILVLHDGKPLLPLIIVAVVIAYVVAARLAPPHAREREAAEHAQPVPTSKPDGKPTVGEPSAV